MVVSQNRGTQISTPKCYNPYSSGLRRDCIAGFCFPSRFFFCLVFRARRGSRWVDRVSSVGQRLLFDMRFVAGRAVIMEGFVRGLELVLGQSHQIIRRFSKNTQVECLESARGASHCGASCLMVVSSSLEVGVMLGWQW